MGRGVGVGTGIGRAQVSEEPRAGGSGPAGSLLQC